MNAEGPQDKKIELRYPNGELEEADHEHAWQTATYSQETRDTTDIEHTEDISLNSVWCAICGAIALGHGNKKVIHSPSFFYGVGKVLRDMDAYKAGYTIGRMGLPLDSIACQRNNESNSFGAS